MSKNETTEQQPHTLIESIIDINTNNIWTLDEYQIAQLWEAEKKEDGFTTSEEKLLNTIRLAFDVVHYDHNDKRDTEKYENGEWTTFSHAEEKKGYVAIRRRNITRIGDLTFENVKHISASMLLELIDRNFGGGWTSIPSGIRGIIESGFDVTTTQLPTSRLHVKGGTLDKKVAAGYEVLEVAKGSWTEAIFVKKKELVAMPVIPDEEENEDDIDDMTIVAEDKENEGEEYYSAYIDETGDGEEDLLEVADSSEL